MPAYQRPSHANSRASTTRPAERQRLPAWLGLYRRLKPEGGESISILWQRGRALRGAEPLVQGVPPLRAALITEAAQLDPSARYVARL